MHLTSVMAINNSVIQIIRYIFSHQNIWLKPKNQRGSTRQLGSDKYQRTFFFANCTYLSILAVYYIYLVLFFRTSLKYKTN